MVEISSELKDHFQASQPFFAYQYSKGTFSMNDALPETMIISSTPKPYICHALETS